MIAARQRKAPARRGARPAPPDEAATAALLARPLRPEDFPVVPFEDATPLLRDDAALRARARALGYLYIKSLLPAAVAAPVRAFVRERCLEHGWLRPARGNPPELVGRPGARLEGHGWDDPRFVALQRALRLLPAFQKLAHHPALLRALEAVAGRPMWLATANYAWLKFPGSPHQTTRPHQDSYYLPRVPSLWTVWVPLVDTPLDVGPLAVVPGSHRGAAWPHVNRLTGIVVDPATTWATGAVRAGDAVLFGARTVHCAWSNVSPTRVRLSLDIRYEARPRRGPTDLRPLP